MQRRRLFAAFVGLLMVGTVCFADLVVVSVDDAPVKRGKEVLARLKKGTELVVLQRLQKWYGVEIETDEGPAKGWIHESQVTLKKAEPAPGAGAVATPTPTTTAATAVEGALGLPDCLGYLRVKNPTGLVQKLTQLVNRFQPGMGMMVGPGIGMYVYGDPMLAQVDSSRPTVLMLFNPKNSGQPFVILAPAKDSATYAANINASGDAAGGARKFAKAVGTSVAIAMDETLLNSVAPYLAKLKPIGTADMQGDAAATVPIPSLLKMFNADIDQGVNMMMGGLEQARENGAFEGQMDPTKILKAEVDFFLEAIRQLDTVGLGVGVEPEAVTLGYSLAALADTALAKTLTSQRRRPSKIARFLPENAAATVVAPTTTMTPGGLIEKFQAMIMEALEVTPEDRSQMQAYQAEWNKMLAGGEMGFSVVSTEARPLQVVLLFDVAPGSDPAGVIKKTITWYQTSSVAKAYTDMGLELKYGFQEGARTYKGARVDRVTVDLPLDKMAMTPRDREQLAMVLGGEKISVELALVDNTYVMTLGSALIESTINGIKAGGRTTAADIGAANGYFHVSFARMIDMIANFARVADDANAVQEIGALQKLTLGSAAVVGRGTVQGRKAGFELEVPVEPVRKLVEHFKTRHSAPRMGAGGPPGGAGGPGGPGAAPPPAAP